MKRTAIPVSFNQTICSDDSLITDIVLKPKTKTCRFIPFTIHVDFQRKDEMEPQNEKPFSTTIPLAWNDEYTLGKAVLPGYIMIQDGVQLWVDVGEKELGCTVHLGVVKSRQLQTQLATIVKTYCVDPKIIDTFDT